MSIVIGCDIGSLASKAVIMKDNTILGFAIIKSKPKPQDSAKEVVETALSRAGLTFKDIAFCVGTGYGRAKIPFAHDSISEISCHGKAARWLVPTAKTEIDIGGQDCKIMKLDAEGKVLKFITNDKCASGTGRFLEVMARALGISLDDLGAHSAASRSPITLASACTVWAQADVIKHLNSGIPIEDISAGINNAMAARISILVNSIGIEPDVAITGGVAKNSGVVSALTKITGHKIILPRRADPQLAGAIGGALFAKERASGRA